LTAIIIDQRYDNWRAGSMSALGQKQTLTRLLRMSALPPKADIAERDLRLGDVTTDRYTDSAGLREDVIS